MALRTDNEEQVLAAAKKWIKLAVFGILGLILFFSTIYTVDAGERAIVRRFGEIQGVTDEGLHMKMPFIDKVIHVDVRTRQAEAPASAGTRDLQMVTTKVSINYHLAADSLADTYKRIGLDVETRVVAPRIQEVVKATVAQYSAEDLLVKRDMVKAGVTQGLTEALILYNIVVEGIQITDFSFSESFDNAIEAKQTAEQNALKAKNDLERIKVEAEQKIAMARAEAETIRIQAEAIRAQGGAEYVQLKAIEKWDGKMPMVTGEAGVFISPEMLRSK